MGKLSISLVVLLFLATGYLTFFGSSLLVNPIRMSPEEFLHSSIPDDLQIEQSLKTSQGRVLVAIDRKNDLRLHIVQPSVPLPERATAEQVYEAAKSVRNHSLKSTFPVTFGSQYISALLDVRRTEGTELPKDVLLLKAPKGQNVIVWVDTNRNIIFLGERPEHTLPVEDFFTAIGERAKLIQ